MKKHVFTKKLALNRETITRMDLREVSGASVRLSCDGLRCSNDSVCASPQPRPLCE